MSFDGWSNELYHYGIKGQRWGVRRFQNPDGTWTTEGAQRYGKEFRSGNRSIGISMRTRLTDSDRFFGLGSGDLREGRVAIYQNKLNRIRSEMSKYSRSSPQYARLYKKFQQTKLSLRAQEASNQNREIYDSRSSIAKLWLQNKLLGQVKAEKYRDARARGSGKGRALAESILSKGTPFGRLMRNRANKRVYGAKVRW